MNTAIISMLGISGLFSVAALLNIRNWPISVLCSMTSIVIVCSLAIATVRPVQAEDDCIEGTYSVQRLPVVGLVCIGEPV